MRRFVTIACAAAFVLGCFPLSALAQSNDADVVLRAPGSRVGWHVYLTAGGWEWDAVSNAWYPVGDNEFNFGWKISADSPPNTPVDIREDMPPLTALAPGTYIKVEALKAYLEGIPALNQTDAYSFQFTALVGMSGETSVDQNTPPTSSGVVDFDWSRLGDSDPYGGATHSQAMAKSKADEIDPISLPAGFTQIQWTCQLQTQCAAATEQAAWIAPVAKVSTDASAIASQIVQGLGRPDYEFSFGHYVDLSGFHYVYHPGASNINFEVRIGDTTTPVVHDVKAVATFFPAGFGPPLDPDLVVQPVPPYYPPGIPPDPPGYRNGSTNSAAPFIIAPNTVYLYGHLQGSANAFVAVWGKGQ